MKDTFFLKKYKSWNKKAEYGLVWSQLRLCFEWATFFTTLHVSLNDCSSAASIYFGWGYK